MSAESAPAVTSRFNVALACDVRLGELATHYPGMNVSFNQEAIDEALRRFDAHPEGERRDILLIAAHDETAEDWLHDKVAAIEAYSPMEQMANVGLDPTTIMVPIGGGPGTFVTAVEEKESTAAQQAMSEYAALRRLDPNEIAGHLDEHVNVLAHLYPLLIPQEGVQSETLVNLQMIADYDNPRIRRSEQLYSLTRLSGYIAVGFGTLAGSTYEGAKLAAELNPNIWTGVLGGIGGIAVWCGFRRHILANKIVPWVDTILPSKADKRRLRARHEHDVPAIITVATAS